MRGRAMLVLLNGGKIHMLYGTVKYSMNRTVWCTCVQEQLLRRRWQLRWNETRGMAAESAHV
jgi:hypothetical protein